MEGDDLKWKGKATAKLLKSTPEEVWPLLEDFCSLHKWLPMIDTCYKVEGADGERGLVRYCSSTQGGGEGGGDPIVKWCHEMLTGIDPVGKWLSYEIMDNNIGFKSYEATLKIKGGDGLGCEIEWSFVADPVVGLSCEDFAAYLHTGLQGMARNLENALESASN